MAIATARYWIGAERYIGEIWPDYEITMDGTLIHRRGEQIYSRCLDRDITDRIIQNLMRYSPQTEITVAAGRQVFGTATAYWSPKNCARLFTVILTPLPHAANKIVAKLSDYSMAEEITHRNCCRLQCYRGENGYAFCPKKPARWRQLHSWQDLCI